MSSVTGVAAARGKAALTNPIVLASAIAVMLVVIGQIVSPGFGAYSQVIDMLRVAPSSGSSPSVRRS